MKFVVRNQEMKYVPSFYLVWLLNTYFRSTSCTAQEYFPALVLVYDKKNAQLDVIDMETVKNHNYLEVIMLACPASELHLNDGSNSLQIEQLHYPPFDSIHTYKICEKQYSPDISSNEENRTYSIGYQFRFDAKYFDIISSVAPMEEDLGDIFWWNVISINFKPNFITTEHIVSPNKYIGNLKNCETFSLAFAFVEDEYIPIAYVKENQISSLNEFMKPKFNEEDDEMYLIAQQLTPIDDFDSRGKRVATCTYLNSAPRWQTVANGLWKRVEKFIKNLAEERQGIQIEIITGTFGQLKLHETRYPYNTRGVNLNETPVPEGFWKLVGYEECDNNEEKSRGIVIFTFNSISGTVLHEPLCGESVCKKFGWNVENDDYRTGYTYCCKAEKVVLDKLGVEMDEKFNDFNLRELSNEHA